MMRTQTAPTSEQAAHFLREVGIGESAIGIVASATAGQHSRRLTSLEQVEQFLKPIEASAYDTHATISFVNPIGLADWVTEVVGDAELGEVLTAIAGDERPYGQQVHDLKRHLAERIEQCRAVLATVEVLAS